ncbi:MAG: ATP-binding protein [Microcoleaceae cyanobacterium]
MVNQINPPIIAPVLSEGKHFDLSLESTLESLPLYDFKVSSECLGIEVAQLFEKYPLVPGVLIVEQIEAQPPSLLGMISRRQFLEFLIRPYGLELFLHQPLRVLYSYARTNSLILPANTLILVAAQKALRRSSELASDPLVIANSEEVNKSDLSKISYRLLDVHELNIAYWQIRGIETQVRYERTQAQMIQSEKMASLGRLVDGVSHEILDPVGFIWGNLSHLTDYHQDLMKLLAAYEQYCSSSELSEIEEIKTEIEFDFLSEDIDQVIESIKSGAERLKQLSTSLQNFCHVDDVHPKPADINSCIENILLLLKSRISSDILISKEYGKLPPVYCYSGQFNQVLMNILTNAIDVLLNQAASQNWENNFSSDSFPQSQMRPPQKQPKIEITTAIHLSETNENLPSIQSHWISIRIADNGPGMSAKKRAQILDSFSIHKRAEKETSLSLSYYIITAKHGGQFKLQSEVGVGTEFEILLPLDPKLM